MALDNIQGTKIYLFDLDIKGQGHSDIILILNTLLCFIKYRHCVLRQNIS
jgi:hypothetical protein